MLHYDHYPRIFLDVMPVAITTDIKKSKLKVTFSVGTTENSEDVFLGTIGEIRDTETGKTYRVTSKDGMKKAAEEKQITTKKAIESNDANSELVREKNAENSIIHEMDANRKDWELFVVCEAASKATEASLKVFPITMEGLGETR